MSPNNAPTVLVLDPVDPGALSELARTFTVVVEPGPSPRRLGELLPEADAVVVRSGVRLTAELIGAARRLRVIVRAGSGTDNIDLGAAVACGVRVFNVPGGSAVAVAELAIGLIFAVTRRIALADRQIRAGRWDKHSLAGPELSGKTLGVVGHGNIGAEIARCGIGLSMAVVTTVARSDEPRRARLAAAGINLVELRDLLTVSDVVVLAVPLSETTRHLIDARGLARMGPTAFLVNVSRAGVVDETALHEALTGGGIAGAATDVLDRQRHHRPLTELDNVVLTPHIGAMTHDAQARIGRVVAATVTTALTGGIPAHQVC